MAAQRMRRGAIPEPGYKFRPMASFQIIVAAQHEFYFVIFEHVISGPGKPPVKRLVSMCSRKRPNVSVERSVSD
jgi:hypothetical protein